MDYVIAVLLYLATYAPPSSSSQSQPYSRAANTETQDHRVVCYYSMFAKDLEVGGKVTADDIVDPLVNCTHLVLTYATLTKEGEINCTNPAGFSLDAVETGVLYSSIMTPVRAAHSSLKIYLALGGAVTPDTAWATNFEDGYVEGFEAGPPPVHTIETVPSSAVTLTAKIIAYLTTHSFDGLEKNTGSGLYAENPEDELALMKYMKAQFLAENFMLSLAVDVERGRLSPLEREEIRERERTVIKQYHNTPFYEKHMLANLSEVVEYVTLKTFNYNMRLENHTSHHSVLSGAGKATVMYTVEKAIMHGLPREKINLAIPTFARTFTLKHSKRENHIGAPALLGKEGPLTVTKGMLATYEVCNLLMKNETGSDIVVKTYPENMAAYAVTNDKQWIGYERRMDVIKKAEYARTEGLGGIAIYSLDMDDHSGVCGFATRFVPMALSCPAGKFGRICDSNCGIGCMAEGNMSQGVCHKDTGYCDCKTGYAAPDCTGLNQTHNIINSARPSLVPTRRQRRQAADSITIVTAPPIFYTEKFPLTKAAISEFLKDNTSDAAGDRAGPMSTTTFKAPKMVPMSPKRCSLTFSGVTQMRTYDEYGYGYYTMESGENVYMNCPQHKVFSYSATDQNECGCLLEIGEHIAKLEVALLETMNVGTCTYKNLYLRRVNPNSRYPNSNCSNGFLTYVKPLQSWYDERDNCGEMQEFSLEECKCVPGTCDGCNRANGSGEVIHKKKNTLLSTYYYARMTCSQRWVSFACPILPFNNETDGHNDYSFSTKFDIDECACLQRNRANRTTRVDRPDFIVWEHEEGGIVQLRTPKQRGIVQLRTPKPTLYPCAVDGNWGDWQAPGPCSVSCGVIGSTDIVRSCDNPAPMYDGLACEGSYKRYGTCDMRSTACPVYESMRVTRGPRVLPCEDRSGNCQSLAHVCCGIYMTWAEENCPASCGFCGAAAAICPTTTVGWTGPPTTTEEDFGRAVDGAPRCAAPCALIIAALYTFGCFLVSI